VGNVENAIQAGRTVHIVNMITASLLNKEIFFNLKKYNFEATALKFISYEFWQRSTLLDLKEENNFNSLNTFQGVWDRVPFKEIL